jgi:hypothetical protein
VVYGASGFFVVFQGNSVLIIDQATGRGVKIVKGNAVQEKHPGRVAQIHGRDPRERFSSMTCTSSFPHFLTLARDSGVFASRRSDPASAIPFLILSN